MPVVHVFVWKGFSEEAKKRTIDGITKVFTGMNIPADAVEIIIHEIPKENWGIGGERASEKLKNTTIP